MHSSILWALALPCITVWVVYNLARPFGWLSPLMVTHRYLKHHNGARYEILLIKWRKKQIRTIGTLLKEIAKNHYAFARELDMITLIEEMNMPSGLSVYSMLPDGRVLVIDTFPQKKDHIRRTSDFVCMGDYDVYAVVNQELVDTHESAFDDLAFTSKKSTVA